MSGTVNKTSIDTTSNNTASNETGTSALSEANRNVVMVVAPHPDDETLGCGGTLLRHLQQGDELHWVIMTKMETRQGFSEQRIASREAEIQQVAERYQFNKVFRGQFATMELDQYSMVELVDFVSDAVRESQPNIIYLPFPGDIHSDHTMVYDAVKSCTKSFRYPSVTSIRVYETLSETDFALATQTQSFQPNLFVSMGEFLDAKLDIMRIYGSELGEHPFPRSERAIRAQATLRGTIAGVEAAESFMTIREIQK